MVSSMKCQGQAVKGTPARPVQGQCCWNSLLSVDLLGTRYMRLVGCRKYVSLIKLKVRIVPWTAKSVGTMLIYFISNEG